MKYHQMAAYNFKERFVPMILDGSKTQTIRANRKGRQGHAKRGDRVYLYYGMRTKWCRKLGEGICEFAQPIRITEDEIYSGQHPLHLFKGLKDRFAWLDGFRPEGTTLENPIGAFELMLKFWRQTHSLPFEGTIIYWKDFKPTP
jgi:hypothetical protein